MNVPDLSADRKSAPGRGLSIGYSGLLAIVMILIGVGAFGLGRLSALQGSHDGLTVVGNRVSASAIEAANALSSTSSEGGPQTGAVPGGVVASKSGTKYFFPWCGGVSSIKEENKVWFKSTSDARSAGYMPSSSCKGLQ